MIAGEGGRFMNRRRIVLSTVLLVLALETPASHFAQTASAGASQADEQNRTHALALGFLRTVNTAEAEDFSKYGSYASWQTLLEHQPQYLNGWVARFYAHGSNVHFGELPEILPGLSLRLNAHADGRGYDVLVEDLSDKSGYAGLSDERAIIRECKWLQ
jgi:hypothetical protein